MTSKSQNILLVLLGVAGVYGFIYADVVGRAKESYLEGEKFMEWNAHPDKKKDFFERQFLDDKSQLDASLAKRKISEAEYKQKLESLEFDKQYALEESSLKYAYQWYKDTYELFSPPESKWVKMARVKAPETLNLWKKELNEKKIPYEDYMFE